MIKSERVTATVSIREKSKEERVKPSRSFKKVMNEKDEVPSDGQVQSSSKSVPDEGSITPFELFAGGVDTREVVVIESTDPVGVIDEVYHTLCEKMVYVESNGIESIEVRYQAQYGESAFSDLTFTIERYDTAPAEWNITFRGHIQGVEMVTPQITNLQTRLAEQFTNQVIHIAPAELLIDAEQKKERFGKRATLLSSEKTQDQKWRRIQAAGSATSQH